MLLVADRVVKRVFVCVKLDLVVEIDELFELSGLVGLVFRLKAVKAHAERAFNLVEEKVEA